ncbi:MAG: ABC transporter ATP-binding protein [Thermoanaerobaculia bacterium]
MVERPVVETKELRKRYDGDQALRGLTLQVPAGSISGFLGRNGAGKTTTMKILLGMTRSTSGDARVFGLDATSPRSSVENRRRVGFVSEEKDLYDSMSVEKMIRMTAAAFPRWRKDLEQRYLRKFELPPGRRIRTLSRGMRTKLALLLSLCRGAELLILDEPTSGLDPAMAEEVLEALVRHVANEEMTVFFSSHQIGEIEQIADRVVIIERGSAVVSGALDDLRERFRRVQVVFDGDAPLASLRAQGIARVRRKGRVLTVWSSAGSDAVVEEARSLGPAAVDVFPMNLKEIFLETVVVED